MNLDVDLKLALQEMNYNFTLDRGSKATIEDTNIIDWEITDSR